jgi:hypothetical protein
VEKMGALQDRLYARVLTTRFSGRGRDRSSAGSSMLGCRPASLASACRGNDNPATSPILLCALSILGWPPCHLAPSCKIILLLGAGKDMAHGAPKAPSFFSDRSILK